MPGTGPAESQKQDWHAPTGHVLRFATCRSRHPVGPEVVVTVGRGALLLLWRGYADAAPQARPAPRFECPTGLSAEIASALLVANSRAPDVAPCIALKALLMPGSASALLSPTSVVDG